MKITIEDNHNRIVTIEEKGDFIDDLNASTIYEFIKIAFVGFGFSETTFENFMIAKKYELEEEYKLEEREENQNEYLET